MLAGLMFGNIGVKITTYIRNDNSDASYQADSVNTASNERRWNGFLEINMGIWGNAWRGVCYIPGDMHTSGGLTKATSSVNMRNLLTRNTYRIVTERGVKKL